ncbi:unnamed protein product [Prunus armeniaca]
MGPVRTPNNPTTSGTSSSYHNMSPYAGITNPTYEVCQHADYSYDTCDLNTISHISPYAGYTNATYEVCQHADYSYDTCDLNTISHISLYAGYTNATYGVCQHAGYSYDTCDLNTISHGGTYSDGKTTSEDSRSTKGLLPKLGQPGPRGPRPPNSDMKVPIGSTRSRTHVLQFWSRSDGRIAHDRTIGRLL